MTKLKLLSAAAILSAVIASPALAQQVIYNPGYCAQFYPDANCQNKGPNNPYTGDYQRRQAYRNGNGNSYVAMNGDASYCAQRYRSYDPASGTYLGRDGRRHACQ
jgi:hypothetical protein